MSTDSLLKKIQLHQPLSRTEQICLPLLLSLPAIMAQLSSVIMQYIDASMVGSLGAEASAAIGLMASSTWLFHGVCQAINAGFTVQAAQSMGAGDEKRTRDLLHLAFKVCIGLSLLLMAFGAAISGHLPLWLGSQGSVASQASVYILVFAFSLPFFQICELCSGMLQSCGNMKEPGFWYIMMCLFDVVFNFFLIYPTRSLTLLGFRLTLPGAGLGVLGAALGTALAHVVVAFILLAIVLFRSPALKLRREKHQYRTSDLHNALRISLPVGVESVMMTGAYVAATRIVAPLGTIAIAANSFAVTAESLCYMPGYGIAAASTALVGQCVGAAEIKLSRRMAWVCTLLGVAVMTITGALMFVSAPVVIGLLTPVAEIRSLAVSVLRVECFAEPLFAASIVACGALRGAGDTLIPGILGFGSMWLIRIPAVAFAVPRFGLMGVWVVIAGEICIRGIVFLIRLGGKHWTAKLTQESCS